MQQYRLGFRQILKVLAEPAYTALAAVLFIPVLWIFTYIAQLGAFAHVLTLEIPLWSRLLYVAESALGLFARMDDPLAVSLIVFSVLATLNIVLLVARYRRGRSARPSASSTGAASIAVIGGHCVACGSSLLTPLITALAGSGLFVGVASEDITFWTTFTVNVVALGLVLHATLRLAARSTL